MNVGLPAVLACTVAGAACASRGVPHSAAEDSKPRISWDIRSDRGNTIVCGSERPAVSCVLTRGTDQRRSSVAVHVLLHSVAIETRYLGVVRAPFMEGSSVRSVGEINVTVPPHSRPVSATTSSGVTRQAGEYTLSIALDAIQEGQPPVRIVQEIPVLVK